jgi:hypothetical protein
VVVEEVVVAEEVVEVEEEELALQAQGRLERLGRPFLCCRTGDDAFLWGNNGGDLLAGGHRLDGR